MQRRLGDLGIKPASPMWRSIVLTTKKSFNGKKLMVPLPFLFISFSVLKYGQFMQRKLRDIEIVPLSPAWRSIILTNFSNH